MVGVFGGGGGVVHARIGDVWEMSPERAEAIYYETYGVVLGEFADLREPVVQRELMLKCWAAVVEAVRREVLAEVEGGAD